MFLVGVNFSILANLLMKKSVLTKEINKSPLCMFQKHFNTISTATFLQQGIRRDEVTVCCQIL